MQVRCIRARVGVEVGEIVDVPDGAEVSDLYFEPVEAPVPPAPPVKDVAVKGGAL